MLASEIPEGARCATHEHARASIVCARCGSYACAECTVLRGGTEVCIACSHRVFGLGGSWLSVWAAILGFAGLGCAPAGLVAIVVAGVDLVRISAKQSPRQGAVLDAIGIVLGIVGTLVWAYAIWTYAIADPVPTYDGYDDYGY